ncbi:MAG: hypothetical protein M3271_02595 [Actinomycetota bacterium]|nr:hypothetical protein [Actinomycetota bacterium]
MTAAIAAAAVLASASLGAAGSAAARTQTLEYVGGGITTGPERAVYLRAGDNVGATVFRGGPERFVTIEIADRHGLPVTGIVSQPDEESVHICGETDRPLRIKPYENVTVFLMNGACGGGASVVTTGTVTATFTRK